jgi:predicted metal-binding membrane protein
VNPATSPIGNGGGEVSVMSIGWMAAIAVLVTAQKFLPSRAALDVPLGLAIVVFGVLTIVDPSWVPGLTPM